MANNKQIENPKVLTMRAEGQKREYSNYIELSANPRDVSIKFCDLKPVSRKEELEEITKNGITIPVNTEVVLPFDVAESLVEGLIRQLKLVKERSQQQESKN